MQRITLAHAPDPVRQISMAWTADGLTVAWRCMGDCSDLWRCEMVVDPAALPGLIESLRHGSRYARETVLARGSNKTLRYWVSQQQHIFSFLETVTCDKGSRKDTVLIVISNNGARRLADFLSGEQNDPEEGVTRARFGLDLRRLFFTAPRGTAR